MIEPRPTASRSPTPDLDAQARRLLRATKDDLCGHLGVPDLDQEMVGSLYLQLRRVLSDWQTIPLAEASSREALVAELALGIYFVATAWDSRAESAPDLLAVLRRRLDAVVNADSVAPSEPASQP